MELFLMIDTLPFCGYNALIISITMKCVKKMAKWSGQMEGLWNDTF